jgi:hypothetical protein
MDDKSHISQGTTTPGSVFTPVEGFTSDAGCGKPPAVGMYGRPGEGEIPTGGKEPSGTGRAIKAYFKGNGGGKP